MVLTQYTKTDTHTNWEARERKRERKYIETQKENKIGLF